MSADELPGFVYSCVEDWFIILLAPTIERRLDASGTLTWCPEWWQHPEAIARIEALWRVGGVPRRRRRSPVTLLLAALRPQ